MPSAPTTQNPGLSTMQPSVLKRLRSLTPQRQLTFSESLCIAELQAARLRELLGLAMEETFPESAIASLPRIHVVRRLLPTSGMSYWDRDATEWVIAINSDESEARQRFSVFHEYTSTSSTTSTPSASTPERA